MLGAEVVFAGDNYDEAFAEASRIAKKSEGLIHAFEDPVVIAGQGQWVWSPSKTFPMSTW